MTFTPPQQTITFEAALRDLASGKPKSRAFAAHALGEVTDPAAKRRAFDALVRALDDDRPEVRAEAAGALGELGEPDALPHLVKRLGDGAAPVRQHAAIALGSLGRPEAFEPLATALGSGAPDLRFQAATSLAEVDPERAFEPIIAALGDADAQVVGAAALAIGAIAVELPPFAPRAREVLAPVVEHGDRGARFDAAYALAELRDPTGLALLAGEAADDERAWDAVTALGWLEARAELVAVLGNKRTPHEAAVLAAGTLLELDPAHELARQVLVEALASRKGHVRSLAVEQLGAAGGAWARPALEKLAKSGKGKGLLETITEALHAIAARERA